jgi:ketosteroid isomerase-like protein
MKVFIFAMILASSASVSLPRPQATKRVRANTVEELRAIEQRLAAAWVNSDLEFINRVLADEWSVTDAAGRVLDKRQVLREAFESKDRQIESLQIDDVQVRIFGGCAVVTGRTRATGRYQGSSMSVTLRFTDVFVRRAGNWQVVASHATQLAQ